MIRARKFDHQVLRRGGLAAALVCVVAAAAPVHAGTECTPEWLPGGSLPGISGSVKAVISWDPDGAGLEPAVTIAGGSFALAGSTLVNNIAAWDGTSWHALGEGVGVANTADSVNALAVLPSGELVVAGAFTTAGGITANRIASWNGTSWGTFGTGTDNTISAVAVTSGGDVIVTGAAFQNAGGVAASRLARWNAATSTWSAFINGTGENGLRNPGARALAVMPNGDVIAGGDFDIAGGSGGPSKIARWNLATSTWSALGAGVNNIVNALVVLPSGNLLVGGTFSSAGGSTANRRLAIWDGANWSALGSGPGLLPTCITITPNGNIFAGGATLQRWDGAAWTTIWNTTGATISALSAVPDGSVVAGGTFITASGVAANNIASYDGSWHAFSDANVTDGAVTALTYASNGDLLAGGKFTKIEGTPAHFIARQHNGVWTALGDGLDTYPTSITELSNGNIVATGWFTTLYGGTVSAPGIAIFDGTTWAPYTSNGFITAPSFSTTLPNGNLLVSGFGGVGEWDGAEWIPLAPGTCCTGVHDVLVLPNDNYAATGGFEGGVYEGDPSDALRVAMYNGFGWLSMGYGLADTGEALAQLPNGDIVVGGRFRGTIGDTPAGRRVLRWDGAAWQLMGDGLGGSSANSTHGGVSHREMVLELLTLPNGDLIAGGVFYNPSTFYYDLNNNLITTPEINNIARWDGTSWQPLGLGVEGFLPTEITGFTVAAVTAMAVAPDGTLVVGGTLTTAGGHASAYLARYGCPLTPPCAADFNGVNGVTVQDIFDFLTAWLAGSPSANFNSVNGVTVQDIFDFLTAWLAGC